MRPPTLGELFIQATSSTRQGYNLLAPNFEWTDYATPGDWVAAALRRVDQLFGSPAGMRGADLACGTGRATRRLLGYCDAVDAYDFSPKMLEEGARRLAGWEEARWIEADLATVDLGAEIYDRIITVGAWGHILPPWAGDLVARVVRALKPGGVFLTLVADPADWWTLRYWYTQIFDNAIKARNILLDPPFHMYYGINDTLTVKRLFEEQPGCRVLLEPVPGKPHPAITLLMAVKDESA